MTKASTVTARPTCSCGYDRYHHFARPKMSYSWFGAMLLMMQFVSSKPTQIAFSCGNCGEEFERTKDEKLLNAFRRYPDVYDHP